MTPALAQAVERAAPGDRVVLLRSIARRHAAARDALLAQGPGNSVGTKIRLTRATRSLAKARALAARFGVRLDVTSVEMAEGGLTDAQRDALTAALADPAACRRLAEACLSRSRSGMPAHA